MEKVLQMHTLLQHIKHGLPIIQQASHWTLPKKYPETFAQFFRWDYDSEIFVFKIQKALISTIPTVHE